MFATVRGMLKSGFMTRQRASIAALAALLATAAGCGRAPETIVVGSMNSTEQLLLGEIVAQHLERRLGRKVNRRPNLGGARNAYQALQNREISLYPEYTGSIVVEILKEQPATDESLLFERAKGEMKRLAQAELMNPLGIDNPFVAVIRADDPRANQVSTLSEAAQAKDGWILGASPEFQQLADGMPALTGYKLPLMAAPRSMDGDLLVKALTEGALTMMVAHSTAGILTQTRWKALADDQHRFLYKQACLLVQQDLLQRQPGLRPALAELSGKFSSEKMRLLNALVDVNQLPLKDVAASFLTQAGLN